MHVWYIFIHIFLYIFDITLSLFLHVFASAYFLHISSNGPASFLHIGSSIWMHINAHLIHIFAYFLAYFCIEKPFIFLLQLQFSGLLLHISAYFVIPTNVIQHRTLHPGYPAMQLRPKKRGGNNWNHVNMGDHWQATSTGILTLCKLIPFQKVELGKWNFQCLKWLLRRDFYQIWLRSSTTLIQICSFSLQECKISNTLLILHYKDRMIVRKNRNLRSLCKLPEN